MPALTSAQITRIAEQVAAYISSQREAFRPQCSSLSATQLDRMQGFFNHDVLRDVVICVTEAGLPNPDFYPALAQMGFRALPDFSTMAAITFSDVVVAQQLFSNELLFHELVHVEQYRQLGIPRFAAFYVRGFLAGGGYEGIPLEINAYELEHRFRTEPGQVFSVKDEVARWIREGRF